MKTCICVIFSGIVFITINISDKIFRLNQKLFMSQQILPEFIRDNVDKCGSFSQAKTSVYIRRMGLHAGQLTLQKHTQNT
jgi:hypothetical protein